MEKKTLTEGKVETLLMELVDGDDKRVENILNNFDLYGFKVHSTHPYKGISSTTNYTFVRK